VPAAHFSYFRIGPSTFACPPSRLIFPLQSSLPFLSFLTINGLPVLDFTFLPASFPGHCRFGLHAVERQCVGPSTALCAKRASRPGARPRIPRELGGRGVRTEGQGREHGGGKGKAFFPLSRGPSGTLGGAWRESICVHTLVDWNVTFDSWTRGVRGYSPYFDCIVAPRCLGRQCVSISSLKSCPPPPHAPVPSLQSWVFMPFVCTVSLTWRLVSLPRRWLHHPFPSSPISGHHGPTWGHQAGHCLAGARLYGCGHNAQTPGVTCFLPSSSLPV
jgi:hypothetical protein